MQYGLFFLCASILLSDYNPFIANKTCVTQALSNHDSLCKEEIFLLEKNNKTLTMGYISQKQQSLIQTSSSQSFNSGKKNYQKGIYADSKCL